MDPVRSTLSTLLLLFAAALLGCSSENGTREHGESEEHSESRGEHDRDGGEHSGEHSGKEGEESGTELALEATYDQVRNGARLILAYDTQTHSFVGTVQNTTSRTLERVRVEVHLSNGVELGPTTPKDLAPGESLGITLTAESTDFDGWTAHPEVGSGEHGHGGEGGEHD